MSHFLEKMAFVAVARLPRFSGSQVARTRRVPFGWGGCRRGYKARAHVVNRPLYHLVFFSRHELPNRIWSDVAQGANREFNF